MAMDLKAQIDAMRASLEAANEAARAAEARAKAAEAKAAERRNGKLTIKVSAKGGISVYGLQRWPVTLYAPQWARLAATIPAVLSFAEANASKLSQKGEEETAS